MSIPDTLRAQIDELVRSSDVVLFMKGTHRFPQCGFSSQVVQILDGLGAPFKDVNVLTDPALRDGIKAYSEWPTIPQLYVKGEFVGGCDIVREMSQNGELRALLGDVKAPAASAAPAAPAAPAKAPSIQLSDSAAAAVKAALEPGDVLRFEIGPGFKYDLSVGPKQAGDVEVTVNGVVVAMDAQTARLADGTSVSFVEGAGGGFRITNPSQPAAVKQMTVQELAAKLDGGAPLHLFDVRTDGERNIAVIARAVPFTPDALEALPKDAPIVFHCHHGGRSQAAAERALAMGFKDVSNLRGGIDAWSTSVDAKVARY
ncbi:MAG TPA: Grx4 family monothiol glutaredoxin [Byssovorax sp.]|jgi:monothiol glutaredoxin